MPVRVFIHRLVFVVFLLSFGSCQSPLPSNHQDVSSSSFEGKSNVHWANWEEETFRVAQEDDKLILLDLTAVWCHACHVMDETTYADPSIISLLNTQFISVRVDTDQRPDIDARYRHGGWPTTSILLPTGEIVFQANFLDPAAMREALLESQKHYRQNKQTMLTKAANIWARVEEARKNRVLATGVIDSKIIAQTTSTMAQNFDEVNGGFRDAQKFFEPEAITFLLGVYHQTADKSLKRMALFTLDQQRNLIDPVWGGFYRYAENADWTRPHYEKMLHLQAANLQNYLEAYQVTDNPSYRLVVEDTMRYVSRFLLDKTYRGFFASQDADVRTRAPNGSLVASGKEYFKLGEAQRLEAGVPFVDRSVYTGWNGQMITSYLKVYQVLGEEKILDVALKILNHLYERRYESGRGMAHREVNGRPRDFGLIGDQVLFAGALLEASLTTGDMSYIEKAERLTKDFVRLLEDEQGGGLYDRHGHASAEGLLRFPHKSLAENLRAAMLLSDLYYVTENYFYRDVAERTLQYVLGSSATLPLGLSGIAIDRFLRYPVHIVVVGSRDNEKTGQLFKEGLRLYAPGKIVRILDPDKDSLKIGEITFPNLGEPRAYVCTDKLCSEPLSEASNLPIHYRELVQNSR